MKIAIDGYEANAPQRLGSSQVAFELISSLEKIDKENEYTILLPTSPVGELPKERDNWKYKLLRPARLWTRIALPLFLYSHRRDFDLIFSPTHYIPRFSPIKRVGIIFDLSFLHFPQMFEKTEVWKLKNWTKYSLENADHLITISNFSKQDITAEYNIKKSKITVAYPGYDKEKFKAGGLTKVEQVKKKYQIKGPYIIYIGTIQPRKNLLRLIEAFSRVSKDIEDLKLVIVGKTKGLGKEGWMYKDILEAPKIFSIEDKVIFTGFVETKELVSLLTGALAFVQVSLWEGFGIPLLEAMGSGVPVISSNVSSLPEVVEEAGLMVDPYSLDQIELAIRTFVTDKKLREKYSKAGREQAKKFSWEKMAKTVLNIFQNISPTTKNL